MSQDGGATVDYDALMLEALGRAMRGRGEVEPNPIVGCLMLQGGQVVGRGFHGHYGGPHAEVVALEDARQAGYTPDTAIVTLEPPKDSRGEEVTSKVSTTLSSLARWMVMLPLAPAWTGSLKIATRSPLIGASVAPSAGLSEEIAGGVVSGPPPGLARVLISDRLRTLS